MKQEKIGCLVMAAGNAERYRSNKLAAVYRGKPLILRALEAVPKELLARVVVVTQYPEAETLAEQFGFEHIRNKHPDWGISHTISLGTNAMKDCDAIVYLVSDQPLLKRQSVEKVITCWQENPSSIVGAAHNGKRGNPCIFPQAFYPELLALKEDCGGNTVIRAHLDRLLTVEINEVELTDIDTPQALEDLEKQVQK